MERETERGGRLGYLSCLADSDLERDFSRGFIGYLRAIKGVRCEGCLIVEDCGGVGTGGIRRGNHAAEAEAEAGRIRSRFL